MADSFEPLTESYFYILLCLYDGPNHGYGIMQKTLVLSAGNVRLDRFFGGCPAGSAAEEGGTHHLCRRGHRRDHHHNRHLRRDFALTGSGPGAYNGPR